MVTGLTYRQLYAAVRGRMPSDFEAEQLFCHVTGWHGYDLPHMGAQAVPPGQAVRLEALCNRRRQGEPLQYLLEEWEFFGLPFQVGEGVLIPRADTELLVEIALDMAQGLTLPRILDLCSGSGAVAVALAHTLPGACVTAVELSPSAMGYLRKNIARCAVAVDAQLADVFAYQPAEPVDIITANPPYIPSGDLGNLQEEVRREPEMALDGGSDGLHFYHGIAARYHSFLSPGGSLCLEIGMGREEAVVEILSRCGYHSITQHRDLGGIIRVVAAKR